MCYSGQCFYEGYLGDCGISVRVRKEWDKKGLCPCEHEWAIMEELEEYHRIRKEIELVTQMHELLEL